MIRRILAWAAVPALALGLLTTGAGPAQAAGCSGATCSGLDPVATGCSADAVTLGPPLARSGVLFEMRYSATCHAAWTRYKNPGASQPIYAQIIAYSCGSTITAEARACRVGIHGTQATHGTDWTLMWSFGYFVRTCYSRIDSLGDPAACTAVH